MVNFVSVFVAGYDANKPYDIQDGNYWDEYYGLILRLKDPKLTDKEKEDIPRMIPLSLDMKCVVMLFITDFLFFYLYFKFSTAILTFRLSGPVMIWNSPGSMISRPWAS